VVDEMKVDEKKVDEMLVGEKKVGEMLVGEKKVGEILAGKMQVGEKTWSVKLKVGKILGHSSRSVKLTRNDQIRKRKFHKITYTGN
jgi:hypothetical protein